MMMQDTRILSARHIFPVRLEHHPCMFMATCMCVCVCVCVYTLVHRLPGSKAFLISARPSSSSAWWCCCGGAWVVEEEEEEEEEEGAGLLLTVDMSGCAAVCVYVCCFCLVCVGK